MPDRIPACWPPEADGGYEGEVEILADPGLDNNLPYFDCSGVGTFTVGANAANFTIDPPPDCDGTMERRLYMFSGFGDAGGRWGSTLMANIDTIATTPNASMPRMSLIHRAKSDISKTSPLKRLIASPGESGRAEAPGRLRMWVSRFLRNRVIV